MKFRTIFTHVIGIIHIAPCPTDLQTPNRGPTQLANDHRPPATSSLAHWLTAHRLTDLYCPTGSPAHRLTGSPAHWPPATGHQPPTTGHLLTCSPAHRPPATGHRLTGSPATGHPPPAHRLTRHRPPAHRPPANHRPPAADHRPPATGQQDKTTIPQTEHLLLVCHAWGGSVYSKFRKAHKRTRSCETMSFGRPARSGRFLWLSVWTARMFGVKLFLHDFVSCWIFLVCGFQTNSNVPS